MNLGGVPSGAIECAYEAANEAATYTWAGRLAHNSNISLEGTRGRLLVYAWNTEHPFALDAMTEIREADDIDVD